jgi:hypothetical protein
VGHVAIVTACYGDFDRVRSQAPQDITVDWLYVTDGPAAPEPWETIVRSSDESPRLAAKRVKCEPWNFTDHPDVIWIDANTEVTHPAFASEALACRRHGVAMFAHPRRDCVYMEAEASVGVESQGGKYDGEPIREQVEHYRAEGHPEHGGLFACGTIAWDATDPRACEFGSDWLAECEQWSIQDQLSAPVVARRLGIQPGVFPFPQVRRGYLGNKWLRIHPHA